MNKIIKITLQDGSEIELKDIKPLVVSENKTEQYKNSKTYEKQFTPFEEKILDNLNRDVIRDYAIDWLDLIDEDEIEEKGLYEFDNEDLLEEIKARGLLEDSDDSIITEDFISRFRRIIEKENPFTLSDLLTELENKLNL